MKTGITIFVIIVIIGLVGTYFFRISPEKRNSFERLVLDPAEYPVAASQIAEQINVLSPTSPTGAKWIVEQVEFVKGEPYAYAVYDDTRNVFRLLLEITWQPYAKRLDHKQEENKYLAVATFETDSNGWNLTHGEDAAKNQTTIVYVFNPQTKVWEERKDLNNGPGKSD